MEPARLIKTPQSLATNAENIRARDSNAIAAAWRLIARDGVLALTVKALADEAGVAASSMRYTMPSQAVVRERALEVITPSSRDRSVRYQWISKEALSVHGCYPSTLNAGLRHLC